MARKLSLELFYWVFVVIFIAAWIPFRFDSPIGNVRHTYQLPSANCSNRLTSDRWGWEYFREGFMVIFILLPFSGLFMIWSKNSSGFAFHTVIAIALTVWAAICLAYDIADLSHANLAPSDPNFNVANLARSPQWCLAYGGQPETQLICANIGTCNSTIPVNPSDLGIDGLFTMRFVFIIFVLAMCVIDTAFTLIVWNNQVLSTPSPQPPPQPSAPVLGGIRSRYNILKRN